MKACPYEPLLQSQTQRTIHVLLFVAAKQSGLATTEPEFQNISIPAACG